MNSEKELMFTITALRNLNVKTICELGAGDCRWAIRMAAELGGEVDAVENLAWKQWEHTPAAGTQHSRQQNILCPCLSCQ